METINEKLTIEEKNHIENLMHRYIQELQDTARANLRQELMLVNKYNRDLYRDFEMVESTRKTMIGMMETLIDYHEQFTLVIKELLGEHDCRMKSKIFDNIKQARNERIYLYQLHLPPKIVISLSKENITSLGDLANKTKKEMRLIKGIGDKTIDMLENRLKSHNLQFRIHFQKEIGIKNEHL